MSRAKNVFVDVGLDSEEATIEAWRSDLARIIRAYFKRAQMSQGAFANKLGVKQPVVSRINNGRLSGLSIEYLLRLCVKLGTRGTATWGPSPDEALVTTDLQSVTGTSTAVSSFNLPAFEAADVKGMETIAPSSGATGSARTSSGRRARMN